MDDLSPPFTFIHSTHENISKCSRLNFIHVLCYFIVYCLANSAYLFTGLLPSSYFRPFCVITLDWSKGEWMSEYPRAACVRDDSSIQFFFNVLYFPHFPCISVELSKIVLIESLSLSSPKYAIQSQRLFVVLLSLTLEALSLAKQKWTMKAFYRSNVRALNNLEYLHETFHGVSHKHLLILDKQTVLPNFVDIVD